MKVHTIIGERLSFSYFRLAGSLLIVGFMASLSLTGQVHPLMDEEVSDHVFTKKWGANKRHYAAPYISLAYPVHQEGEHVLKTFGSPEWTLGGRYKLRFCDFYSTGFDLWISNPRYSMKTMNTITINNLIEKWDKEKITAGSLSGAWYHRFNLQRRGNTLGTYLDAGIYGQYLFSSRYRFYGKEDGYKIEATKKAPELLYKTIWGFQASVGTSDWKLFARYRMSNLLKTWNVADLPKLSVGLEVTLSF